MRLLGRDTENTRTWKEFALYRDRRLVQVANLVEHGRLLYRNLVFSSDAR